MLTAQQICTYACQIAKCPGYTTQAGDFLNLVLESLAIKQNLDSIRRTATLSVNSGVPNYNLPLNFLRARQVFYNVNGAIYQPTEISLAQYNGLFQGNIATDYPYNFAVDMAPSSSGSAPIIYFYPNPLTGLTVTVQYQDDTVTITNPSTSSVIPWFIDHDYLVNAVAQRLMKITDDVRHDAMKFESDDKLREFLRLNNGNTLKTVSLDPRVFRSGIYLPPDKLIQ